MKRDTMILLAAVAGVGVLFWTKKAKAATSPPAGGGGGGFPGIPPIGGGIGDTVPLAGGGRAWSPTGAAMVKQKLAQCAALPDLPGNTVPSAQAFTLQPTPFTLAAADLLVTSMLASGGGTSVWTDEAVTRLLVTPGPSAPNSWILLATASQPGLF